MKLNRINDGKTDPAGNLWFGTMDNLERKIEKGSLYKLDKNRFFKSQNCFCWIGIYFSASDQFFGPAIKLPGPVHEIKIAKKSIFKFFKYLINYTSIL